MLDIEFFERFRNQRLETIELFSVERLLDVIVGAFAHRLHGGVDCPLACHDDALGRNPQALQLLQKCETVELRHHQVRKHDTEAVSAQMIERLLSILRDDYVVPLVAEYCAQAFRNGKLIVSDENLRLIHWFSRDS